MTNAAFEAFATEYEAMMNDQEPIENRLPKQNFRWSPEEAEKRAQEDHEFKLNYDPEY